MTFRSKLFWIFTLALVLSVGLVAAGVTIVTRRAFDDLNRHHSDALVAQFNKEIDRRKLDVAHRVEGVAEEEGTVRMATTLALPNADISRYVDDATGQVTISHVYAE